MTLRLSLIMAMILVSFETLPVLAQPGMPPTPPRRLPTVQPPSTEQQASQSSTPSSDSISADLTNMPVQALAKYVSDLTGKNFILDERVKGRVSLLLPSGVEPDQIFDLFVSVLRMKGLVVVPEGNLYLIRPILENPVDRGVHVIRVLNANAEDLAKIITGILTNSRNMAGTMPVRQVTSPGDFEGQITVLADKATNSLIVTGTERDFKLLKGVINDLDIPRRQVYVEAVIMEVTLEKFRQLGATLTGSGSTMLAPGIGLRGGLNADPDSTPANNQATSSLASSTTSASIPLPGSFSAKLLLQALASTADTNILSAPQILATDGQKARIVVGSNVPFLTGTAQSSGGQTVQTVERRDIGVTLEFTPQILANAKIRLDVRQEISDLVPGASTEILTKIGPSTTKREATTSLIIDHEQTVVIGGLVKDNITKTTQGIPFLSDIPFIGWLFKSESFTAQKTNLLIFLTPRLITTPADAETIREDVADSADGFTATKSPLSKDSWQERLDHIKKGQPLRSKQRNGAPLTTVQPGPSTSNTPDPFSTALPR